MYTRFLTIFSLLACTSIVSSYSVLAAGTCTTGSFVIEHMCTDDSCVSGAKTSVNRTSTELYEYIQGGSPQNASIASMIGNVVENVDGYCTGNNNTC